MRIQNQIADMSLEQKSLIGLFLGALSFLALFFCIANLKIADGKTFAWIFFIFGVTEVSKKAWFTTLNQNLLHNEIDALVGWVLAAEDFFKS